MNDTSFAHSFMFSLQQIKKRPQNILPIPNDLERRIKDIVTQSTGCAEFVKSLLENVKKNGNGDPDSTDAVELFKRIERIETKKTEFQAEANFFDGDKRAIYLKRKYVTGRESDKLLEHERYGYAMAALNDLMHHARESGVYSDRALAQAIFPLLTDEEKIAHPLPTSSDYLVNSKYFHPLFNTRCHSLTGER